MTSQFDTLVLETLYVQASVFLLIIKYDVTKIFILITF